MLPHWQIKKLLVRIRHERVCWLCGEAIPMVAAHDYDAYSIDHVIPQALGGLDAVDNLRPAHKWCNQFRRERFPGSLP